MNEISPIKIPLPETEWRLLHDFDTKLQSEENKSEETEKEISDIQEIEKVKTSHRRNTLKAICFYEFAREVYFTSIREKNTDENILKHWFSDYVRKLFYEDRGELHHKSMPELPWHELHFVIKRLLSESSRQPYLIDPIFPESGYKCIKIYVQDGFDRKDLLSDFRTHLQKIKFSPDVDQAIIVDIKKSKKNIRNIALHRIINKIKSDRNVGLERAFDIYEASVSSEFLLTDPDYAIKVKSENLHLTRESIVDNYNEMRDLILEVVATVTNETQQPSENSDTTV